MRTASTRERRVVLLALAAVALHVVVDGFVATEPGTRWDDHVVPTDVPLAILVLAGALSLRARPGVVAATALVFGVWSLVGAGIAAADTALGRVRADTVTGLLLGAAGLVLVGAGFHLLWHSRQRDGRWVARRLGLGVLAAVLLPCVAA